jgi:hypothetical protein
MAARRVTKPSRMPLALVSSAPVVVGKFVESVSPASVISPFALTAMPLTSSSPLPPRKVDHTSDLPSVSSKLTKRRIS